MVDIKFSGIIKPPREKIHQLGLYTDKEGNVDKKKERKKGRGFKTVLCVGGEERVQTTAVVDHSNNTELQSTHNNTAVSQYMRVCVCVCVCVGWYIVYSTDE